MKKYFLLFCLFTIALSSCRKLEVAQYNATTQAQTDDAIIQAYLKLNNITTTTKSSDGLYYEITNPGTGPHPTTASNITVAYSVNLLGDNTVLAQEPSHYFSPLSSLIQAWQESVPLIGTGGSITLYVPSVLAYGNTAHGTIPANAVTRFFITLQGFNN